MAVTKKMHTYLTLWFSSEGASPVEVSKILKTLNFDAMHGSYDFVYAWDAKPSVDDLLKLGNSVQKALIGSQAMFKMETI